MVLFKIENLNFSYPNSKNNVLSDISFSIQQGEFICICGKSGCGKSTLIRHLKTSLAPYGKTTGNILYNGINLYNVSDRIQASQIGFVTQNPDNQIVTDKVWHEISFGLENLGIDLKTMRIRVCEISSYFGIHNIFDKKVSELSGGQKQILNLASVMALHPKVLILDEPTSQLDPISATEFLQTLKRLNDDFGITVIIIEHRLDEVFAMADKILIMENGKILGYDTPKNIGQKVNNNDMFTSFPIPMQIYKKFGQIGECPITVKDGRIWIDNIIKENNLKLKVKENDEENSVINYDNDIVKVENIYFRYDKNLDDVIKCLNFKVKEKEIYCILGANGSGKSTTLSLLCNIYKAYRGKVYINGKNINKYKSNELFNGLLALLPQDPQTLFVSDSVKNELDDMVLELKLNKSKREEMINQVIKDTEIEHLLTQHPYDLSGGEQQRVALAKILLLNPKIILLDEPTKGLDGFYKKKLVGIIKNLRKNGTTFIIVSHDIEFSAEIADTCAMFFNGRLEGIQKTREFFTGNNFYTTAINRMVRHIDSDAILIKDINVCKNE